MGNPDEDAHPGWSRSAKNMIACAPTKGRTRKKTSAPKNRENSIRSVRISRHVPRSGMVTTCEEYNSTCADERSKSNAEEDKYAKESQDIHPKRTYKQTRPAYALPPAGTPHPSTQTPSPPPTPPNSAGSTQRSHSTGSATPSLAAPPAASASSSPGAGAPPVSPTPTATPAWATFPGSSTTTTTQTRTSGDLVGT